jgi:hypothetical protein
VKAKPFYVDYLASLKSNTKKVKKHERGKNSQEHPGDERLGGAERFLDQKAF